MKFCRARASRRIWRRYGARQRINVKLRKSNISGQVFFLSCAILLAVANVLAQESSSKPDGNTASGLSETTNTGGPSAALKGALSAACSQNQTEFVRFLTARHKEEFSRMTPSPQGALTKHFVLPTTPAQPTA